MTPESTSPAKTVQMLAHGATVELIPGASRASSCYVSPHPPGTPRAPLVHTSTVRHCVSAVRS
jgi:hypothetical protein